MRPNPARGPVEMRWARVGMASRIEVFDLAGALRFRADVASGAEQLMWSGTDAGGRALPGGIYFVRRTAGSMQESARLVLVR